MTATRCVFTGAIGNRKPGSVAPADAKLVSLIESLSGLSADPRRVPTAVRNFNEFVAVASPTFLVNPPADFLALHAVLARITIARSRQ